VVDTALAFERDRRWPSAHAMRDALLACGAAGVFSATITPATLQATVGMTPEDSRPMLVVHNTAAGISQSVAGVPRRRPLLAVFGVVALILGVALGAGSWVLYKKNGKAPAGSAAPATTSPPEVTIAEPLPSSTPPVDAGPPLVVPTLRPPPPGPTQKPVPPLTATAPPVATSASAKPSASTPPKPPPTASTKPTVDLHESRH